MNVIENIHAKILDSTETFYDVSVCIITYNKAKYIRSAMESVLMQKTTCKYEIVIGDNQSTDGTRELLHEYWEKYPEKVAVILNDQNLGLTTNMYNTMRKCKGKYIIVLYGDDYWISDRKIQEQFDFLEKNPEFIGVTSCIESRYNDENEAIRTFPCPKLRGKSCCLDDYLDGYDFPMAGVMFRNDVFTEQNAHFKKMLAASLFIDDLSFCILLLMKGNVHIISDVTAVYRCFKKGEGANNFNTVNPKLKRDRMSIELLNRIDDATGNTLDLGMRYGLILASAVFAVLKRELKFSEYRNIAGFLSDRYVNKSRTLLLKGIFRKVYLSTIGR